MNFGGNKIKKINKKKIKSKNIIANKNIYFYEYINAKNKIFNYNLKDISIFIIYSKRSYIITHKKKILLQSNMLINISNLNFTLQLSEAKLFIAGTKINKLKNIKFSIVTKNKIYKVYKPWGYELWFTGKKNKNFSFKKIFIKPGCRTSLQYHNKKEETNFLYSGRIYLHYSIGKFNNHQNYNIKKKILSPYSIIDIKPKYIHRVETLSEVELYEVSTPHLDDVIRLDDDTNRKSGKIVSEHKKK